MPVLRAVVFINWSMPLGFGHVGWGFEYQQDHFYFGAVEVTNSVIRGKGENIALFNEKARRKQMVEKMRTGDHGGGQFQYHAYKYVKVRDPNISAPLKLIRSVRKNGYGLLGNNCMDATYRVIRAYANDDDNVLPWPITHWAPRSFFSDIKTPEFKIQDERGLWGVFGI